jgi:methionyl-tRNA formyltransferase
VRIVVMGTGPFAVPSFRWLVNSEHTVCALFTRPVPPAKGRRKSPVNPMREAAEAIGVDIFAPADINSGDAQKQVAAFESDLLVVCDYGQILSRQTLATSRLGGINLHGSLLPKYRGAAPVNWAIYQGERETGVTVIHMTPKLDGGPCLIRASTAIDPDETAIELEERLSHLGVDAVADAIKQLDQWDGQSLIGESQDQALATKAPRLTKENGRVDWSRTAEQIRNQVRAFKPWPGTYFDWDCGKSSPTRMILDDVSNVDEAIGGTTPGTVVSADKKHIWVATGHQLLSLDRVQPAGKKPMNIDEFLRGHQIKSGDAFS